MLEKYASVLDEAQKREITEPLEYYERNEKALLQEKYRHIADLMGLETELTAAESTSDEIARPLADRGTNEAEQSPKMDDSARAAFLDQFLPDGEGITVGLAVMGGVFAEGIDLPAERLCGAVIVGVGLPQLCLERDVLRDAYEETYQSGFRYAYQYPGMSKVLQAAGRIIRTETDRGALLLIDTRYSLADYRALLPTHWSLQRIRNTAELNEQLSTFWKKC